MGIRLLGLILTAFTAFAGDRHLGPVTDIVVMGSRVFSVSQGGVFNGAKKIYQPSIRVCALAADGDDLVLVGGDPGVSGMVIVLHPKSGRIRSLRVADDLVYDVAVHSGVAALGCADGRVLTVDVARLNEPTTKYRHTAAVRAVAFNKSGSHLASGGLDSLVMLLPLKDGSKPIPMQDHTAKVDCLVFSPDGKSIASGARDGKVRIHNLEGRLVRTYLGIASESAEIVWDNNPYIFSLAWGGQPSKLFAGAAKGGIYELSLANNTWKRTSSRFTQPIYSLRFVADKTLMIGAHGQLTR
ncbi:MAG: WD40 repeat domain-containing protein [Limisphaerales bacterium]